MIRLLPAILGLLVLAACSGTAPQGDTDGEKIPSIYPGFSLDGLQSYHASFLLQFTGGSPWSYQVDLRSDGSQLERSLHIEGVDPVQNPGDVRMVTHGDQNRMAGQGTDGECLVFPEDFDLGPAFLLPDQILAPRALNPYLQDLGEEGISGMKARRYGLMEEALGSWSDVLINIWLAEEGQTTLRYDLQMTGEDPLFGTGQGTLSGRFVVLSFEPQVIEPLTGCETEYPLPESARSLVKLPGLVAFDSPEPAERIVSFYQQALAQSGWVPSQEPEQAGDAIVQSYQRGEEGLEVVIRRTESGVHVELLAGN